ncbi:MAG: TlyA family RNA methyltransferase [Oscillospiraceae bacterium]|nr:TlyA family RNA methyltransferase [Oscillospiraceae bacterium]
MKTDQQRLDLALIQRGLAPSREKAKAWIMAGLVYVNGQKELKAGRAVKEGDRLEARNDTLLPFVSRGGSKLQKAVETFGLKLESLVCMDVGASTGGFTDCMLSHGAAKVYAIDVGYGQLAWKLRGDARVVCLERTNFRYVTRAQVPEPIQFSSVDVSFISLKLIFPVLYGLLAEEGEAVCLVKPQFEAGRERVGKKGVVREPAVQEQVISELVSAARQEGFFPAGLTFSPIKGPEGNIEFLLHLKKKPCDNTLPEPAAVVAQAWESL